MLNEILKYKCATQAKRLCKNRITLLNFEGLEKRKLDKKVLRRI
jgi:hypothetical protein